MAQKYTVLIAVLLIASTINSNPVNPCYSVENCNTKYTPLIFRFSRGYSSRDDSPGKRKPSASFRYSGLDKNFIRFGRSGADSDFSNLDSEPEIPKKMSAAGTRDDIFNYVRFGRSSAGSETK